MTGPFTADEIDGRLAALRVALDGAGLDAVLLTSYPAIFHQLGTPIHQFGRPAAALVPVAGEPAIVCSIIEISHVRAQSPVGDVRTYRDLDSSVTSGEPQPPLAALVAHLGAVVRDRRLDRGRVGFEDGSLSARTMDRLRAELPDVEWVAAGDLVDRRRLVKSPAELAILRAADAIADDGLETALDGLRAGSTAREIHEAARTRMLDAVLVGHEGVPFHLRIDPGLGEGSRSAGHSEWALWDSATRPAAGRVLVVVIDAILWGYTGNVERTVVVGEPTARVRRDFETMVEANERAIATIGPGVGLADVDRACKAVLSAAGHDTRTGSGVGRGPISYEGGWRELLLDVRLYSDVVLEAGVAFSLEPDLQTPDGTYRHCNTIIVTEAGCQVDSRLPRDVLVV